MSFTPSAPRSLANRLLRRAIDLLVVAFLITVGLSSGAQLVDWWRTDPGPAGPDLSGLNPVDLDWSRTPVTLQFGNAATSLERIPFQGDRDRLDEELTRIGKSIVTGTEPPSEPVADAERDWLIALNMAPPVFWDSTRGNVYRRQEPLPSFVATRFIDASPEPGPDQGPDAAVIQRIVGWGIAFPSSKAEWTIYVFHPRSARSARPETLPAVALPDGSRNVTDLHGSDGCRWQVIQGRGDLPGWVQQFDRQFAANDRVSRVVGNRTASMKYRRERVETDVQIRSEPDGSLTGVIWSAKEREPR